MEDEYELKVGCWIKDIPYACHYSCSDTECQTLIRYYMIPHDYVHLFENRTIIQVPEGLDHNLFLLWNDNIPQKTIRVNGKKISNRTTKEFMLMRHNTILLPSGEKEDVFIWPPHHSVSEINCEFMLYDHVYENITLVPENLKRNALAKSVVYLAKAYGEYSTQLKQKRRNTTTLKSITSLISKYIKFITNVLIGKTVQVRQLSKIEDDLFVEVRNDKFTMNLDIEYVEMMIYLGRTFNKMHQIDIPIVDENIAESSSETKDLSISDYCSLMVNDDIAESSSETKDLSISDYYSLMVNEDSTIDYAYEFKYNALDDVKLHLLANSYHLSKEKLNTSTEGLFNILVDSISTLNLEKHSHSIVLCKLRRILSDDPDILVCGIFLLRNYVYFFSNNPKSSVFFELRIGDTFKQILFSSSDNMTDIRYWKKENINMCVLSHNYDTNSKIGSDEGWSKVSINIRTPYIPLLTNNLQYEESDLSHADISNDVQYKESDIADISNDVQYDEYPHLYKLLTNDFPRSQVMQEMFSALKSYNIPSKSPFIVERTWPDDYLLSDGISNFFSGDERVKCKKASKAQSPFDHWFSLDIQKRQEILSKGLLEADEYLYPWVCNNFNPTFYIQVLKRLSGSSDALKEWNVLDPSAGWGDRLIGAMACEVKRYVGFDPNTNLQNAYCSIVETLCPNFNWNVFPLPFDSIHKSNLDVKFDIAFTSPPYFILEEYPHSDIQRTMTYEEWMSTLYIPYLDFIVDCVKDDGWIVLYIENISINRKLYTLAEDTILHYDKNMFLKHEEDVGLLVHPSTKVRYAHVWKKVSQPNRSYITSTNFKNYGIRNFFKYASYFPKSNYNHRKIDYALTSLTEESLFSTSSHDEIIEYGKWIKSVVEKTNGKVDSCNILDACAHVGGDTLGFLSLGFKKVFSIEINEFVFRALETNVYRAMKYPKSRCELILGDFNHLYKSLPCDIIYIDAPWGGKRYKEKQKIMPRQLYLGQVTLRDILNNLFLEKRKCVILKVPINFDDTEIVLPSYYTRERHTVTRSYFDRNENVSKTYNAYLLIAYYISENRNIREFTHTYVVTGHSGLDHGPFRKYMKDIGYQEQNNSESSLRNHQSNTDFVMVQQKYHYDYKNEDRYDKSVDAIQTLVKNVFSNVKRIITDKSTLYRHIKSVYIPENGSLDYISPDLRGVIILKPSSISAGGGEGIKIINVKNDSDYEILQSYQKEILSKWKNGLWSRYIDTPLLYKGRKTHIRFFLVIRSPFKDIDGNVVPSTWKVLSTGRILYAKSKYVRGHYENSNIHDTHIKTSKKCLYFPQDFDLCKFTRYNNSKVSSSMIDDILKGVNCVLGEVYNLLVNSGNVNAYNTQGWFYPETHRGAYEVFGCDFMIDTKDPFIAVPYLLEVNDRISNIPSTNNVDVFQYINIDNDERWNLDTINPKLKHTLWNHSTFSQLWWEEVLNFTLLSVLDYSTPYTFIISGDNGIDHTPLRNLLKSKGFVELDITYVKKTGCRVGLIVQEKGENRNGKVTFDKQIYPIKSVLRSILSDNKSCITDKWKLYDAFNTFSDQYTAKTILVDKTFNLEDLTPPYIVKPVSIPGYFIGGGEGIGIFTDPSQVLNHVNYLSNRYPSNPAIVSQYITSPLTFKTKKMHFRMYMLVNYDNTVTLFHQGKILTAKQTYTNSNYESKEMHDTHIKSTDKDYYIDFSLGWSEYPEDISCDLKAEIYRQMKDCERIIETIVKNNRVSSYPESNFAYELFGADFMYDTNNSKVILLEVNDNIGIGKTEDSTYHTYFSEEIWNFIYENVFSKIFTFLGKSRALYSKEYSEYFLMYVKNLFPDMKNTNVQRDFLNIFDMAVHREYDTDRHKELYEIVKQTIPIAYRYDTDYALRCGKEVVKEISTKYRRFSSEPIANIIIYGDEIPCISDVFSNTFRIAKEHVIVRSDMISLSNLGYNFTNLLIINSYSFDMMSKMCIETIRDILRPNGLLYIKGYNEVYSQDEKPYYNSLIELCDHLQRIKLGLNCREPLFYPKEDTISAIEKWSKYQLKFLYYEEKPNLARRNIIIFQKQ